MTKKLEVGVQGGEVSRSRREAAGARVVAPYVCTALISAAVGGAVFGLLIDKAATDQHSSEVAAADRAATCLEDLRADPRAGTTVLLSQIATNAQIDCSLDKLPGGIHQDPSASRPGWIVDSSIDLNAKKVSSEAAASRRNGEDPRRDGLIGAVVGGLVVGGISLPITYFVRDSSGLTSRR